MNTRWRIALLAGLLMITESTDGALTEYVYLGDMPVAVLK